VTATPPTPPRPRAPRTERRPPRAAKLIPAALLAVALFCAPWWSPPLLRRMRFFQVRTVEVFGTHYIPPDDILARLRVDTTNSVWDDLGPLERRVAEHPQVRTVSIERRLPGTLVVRVSENLPVAFVPAAGGLRATDADGHLLPLDPSKVDIDLPVLERPDTALVRLLADVRGASPALFAQISAARRLSPSELTFALPGMLVRTTASVNAARLADVLPVEQDLARRHARAAELDLRYRDQVIAKLQ